MVSRRMDRHRKIGFKQVVRVEWYDAALQMLLDGQPADDIRQFLDAFISERKQSGGFGERGEKTYTAAISQIMHAWVTPAAELREYRGALLHLARELNADMHMPLHWAATCVAHPFWFQISWQFGRLSRLQEVVSLRQLRQRCFEQLGERSTVARSLQRVMRTFVAWRIVQDIDGHGHYQPAPPVVIADDRLGAMLLESALWAVPEGQLHWRELNTHPAFFPFQLPPLWAADVERDNERVVYHRQGLDDEILQARPPR